MTAPYLIPQNELPEDYISIHTSDRNSYRRCRRKWNWTSALREHLEPVQINDKFFVGNCLHYSMEDFHGYNYFGHPYNAFKAYYDAYKEWALEKETEEYSALLFEEETEFAQGLLDHYASYWLKQRNLFETLWIDSNPLVEVEFSIYIPELSEHLGKPVIYQGKVDRVVKDDIGRLWIVEYKTTTAFENEKLQTDPQCSNYAWASQFFLPEPVSGIIHMQFVKDAPKPPRILKNGDISTAKDQKTTLKLLRDALIEKYGLVPSKYNDLIKNLMEKEDDYGDSFIRVAYVERNNYHRANEYPKILAEAFEMTSENLIAYPNPTRDCSWDCDFRTPCLLMDGGLDWQYVIKENYQKREEGDKPWLNKIKVPQPTQ